MSAATTRYHPSPGMASYHESGYLDAPVGYHPSLGMSESGYLDAAAGYHPLLAPGRQEVVYHPLPGMSSYHERGYLGAAVGYCPSPGMPSDHESTYSGATAGYHGSSDFTYANPYSNYNQPHHKPPTNSPLQSLPYTNPQSITVTPHITHHPNRPYPPHAQPFPHSLKPASQSAGTGSRSSGRQSQTPNSSHDSKVTRTILGRQLQ